MEDKVPMFQTYPNNILSAITNSRL